MHIIMMLLGAFGAIAAVIWRIRMMGEAARSVADVAETAANLPRRMRFLSKSRKSGLQTVDDPREAATILLLLVARADGEVTSEQKRAIRDQIMERFEFQQTDAEDLMSQMSWLSQDIANVDAAVDRMTALLRRSVGDVELRELADMMRCIANTDGSAGAAQSAILDRYEQKIQL